ncbi:transcriptional regulator [Nisaea sediminum]|uniref:transcriptional regulator n=1 Tax=Nisaea sediminum TaxID=2775867 RepID=UPI00186829B6|nr:transcriptional regulator [Nisaea sediminum]
MTRRDKKIITPHTSEIMITGVQIYAAKGGLGWSNAHLAEVSGVSKPTIDRINRTPVTPKMLAENLASIEAALRAGSDTLRVEFIGEDGVRFIPKEAL